MKHANLNNGNAAALLFIFVIANSLSVPVLGFTSLKIHSKVNRISSTFSFASAQEQEQEQALAQEHPNKIGIGEQIEQREGDLKLSSNHDAGAIRERVRVPVEKKVMENQDDRYGNEKKNALQPEKYIPKWISISRADSWDYFKLIPMYMQEVQSSVRRIWKICLIALVTSSVPLYAHADAGAIASADATTNPSTAHTEITTTTKSEAETETITEDTKANHNYMPKQRYWDILNTNPASSPSTIGANEKLLDQAVGTIMTMYYDNTGGARFSTKDMYDRWKVMRVYAKEGVEGVRSMRAGEANARAREMNRNNRNYVNGNGDDSDSEEDIIVRDLFVPQLFLVEEKDGVLGVQVQPQHIAYPNLISKSMSKASAASTSTSMSIYTPDMASTMPPSAFDDREKAVTGLKWLVSTLKDPYSMYLTRDDLNRELQVKNDGFLGLGLIVEPPPKAQGVVLKGDINTNTNMNMVSDNSDKEKFIIARAKVDAFVRQNKSGGGQVVRDHSFASAQKSSRQVSSLLTVTRVANLPRVTAIAPDSPAERAGIVVGDRIAGVGSDKFIGMGRDEVVKRLDGVYIGAENYIGYPVLTVAKPVTRSVVDIDANMNMDGIDIEKAAMIGIPGKEELLGYKLSKVRLPTASLEPYKPYKGPNVNDESALISKASIEDNVYSLPGIVPSASAVTTAVKPILSGGDSIVHWELLTPDDSIFLKDKFGFEGDDTTTSYKSTTDKIGYIRMTRFSRLSTAGYSKAIEELEQAGAQSYIIDVRNNYGGIIQESMLTAATLLRDPHTVLCYTLNSRGGFTPHDAEEYIVDDRYPGYFLSSEPKTATYDQVKRENPEFVAKDGGWVPPSAYSSIREQRMTRKINRPTGIASINPFEKRYIDSKATEEMKQLNAQKQVVILMNEGTASAAEVFVSSLHDNGRTVALVGTKTYGKGLIQHTFPMPDGGGLRLTVAEYLTPALQHVTKVGGANYDRDGVFVGGGVKPDIFCPNTQGIPANIGADICVGLAMDALEDANAKEAQMAMEKKSDGSSSDNLTAAARQGGIEGGSSRRRTLIQGIAMDTY